MPAVHKKGARNRQFYIIIDRKVVENAVIFHHKIVFNSIFL
jgi:hypothetical protein